MMKVYYSEMDTPAGLSCRLEAAGHAGYAPAGQDIVCAGASTVMQGLVYLLAGEENAHSEAFDEPDGPRLAVSVDAPCEEWVRGAFELAKACFALLAERYPENVRFADVSRRGKESMMDLQLFAAEATAACGGNREPRLGQRSDFSKPCQGAAEKSANATRTGASRQIPSRFPTPRNVYRDDRRFVVGGTGREPERAKAGYHHDGGILPFALICFISRSQHPLQYSLRENSP